MSHVTSYLRVLAGLVSTGVLVALMTPVLLVLLPFRVARIRVTNAFGSLVGRAVMWCAGAKVTLEGLSNLRADRPAIYAFNHTSLLDAFTTVWLTPSGTVGVAKKEVFYYPFYGQAWWLAGHLFLDRGQTAKAKAALVRMGQFVRNKSLHLCILPEGTRSKNGRLLPFKKGIVHVALATRLPIIPVVTIGLQHAWQKSTLALKPAKIRIVCLPPISTEDWTDQRIDEQLEQIRAPFLRTLPADQLPPEPPVVPPMLLEHPRPKTHSSEISP